jgi:cyclophilin type peptidyl-prolyl cis-trans isomerase/CLD
MKRTIGLLMFAIVLVSLAPATFVSVGIELQPTLLWSVPLAAQTQPQQAVVETSAGTFIIDLDSATAPNHVAYFSRQAQTGAYDGTIFHRMVKYGIVQGGDPHP